MSRTLPLIFGALAFATLASGCATLSPSWNDSLVEAEVPALDSATDDQPSGKYMVEMRPARGERERVEIAFQGVPYVQTALEQSGAIQKFGRMKVEILRTTDGRKQKMRSAYDHIQKRVPIEWDYALYPGDAIIVTEDPSSMFDDMVESALGPMAILRRGG